MQKKGVIEYAKLDVGLEFNVNPEIRLKPAGPEILSWEKKTKISYHIDILFFCLDHSFFFFFFFYILFLLVYFFLLLYSFSFVFFLPYSFSSSIILLDGRFLFKVDV